MRTHAIAILAAAAAALASIGASAQARGPEPGPTPRLQVPSMRPSLEPRPRGLPLGLRTCPDPAAYRIDFAIVSRTSQFAGRVRITGVVRNVGLAPYESRPGQQGLLLYEDGRFVAQAPFGNLAAGQEGSVSYERTWNASSPAEGEFPPSYRLIITYDPDITLDSNPRNDDCVASDNDRTRSGAGVNDLFR